MNGLDSRLRGNDGMISGNDKLRKLWLAAGWGFIALVIYLSLNTDPPDPGTVAGVKTGHFMAYGWLMLWFSQVHGSIRSRALLAVAFVSMGIALEYVQAMTPHRTFGYTDMRDDALGVGVGWILAAVQGAFLRGTKFGV